MSDVLAALAITGFAAIMTALHLSTPNEARMKSDRKPSKDA